MEQLDLLTKYLDKRFKVVPFTILEQGLQPKHQINFYSRTIWNANMIDCRLRPISKTYLASDPTSILNLFRAMNIENEKEKVKMYFFCTLLEPTLVMCLFSSKLEKNGVILFFFLMK